MEKNLIYDVEVFDAIKLLECGGKVLNIKRVAVKENNRVWFAGRIEDFQHAFCLIIECNPAWTPKVKNVRYINNTLVLEVSEI